MKWLNESMNKSKSLKDTYSLHDIEIFIKDQMPEHINMDFVLKYIKSRIPSNLLRGVDMIYVGKFKHLEDKEANAVYLDGAIYLTNIQDDDKDLIDDIIHEMAHHLEVIAADEIYSDRAILDEFVLKRKQLNFELRSEGYDTSKYDFEDASFNKGLDFFLYKRVGYKTLSYLVPGLFVRPYAVVSVREYFASGIESYYLGKKTELYRTSPVLYKKIEELHQIAS